MFSKPYQGVKHFGVWAEESAGRFGVRDALGVLQHAVSRCVDEDVRTEDVFAALEFLEAHVARRWPLDQFRRGLETTDPYSRTHALSVAIRALRRSCGMEA
jgi:hypothetical protein